MWCNENIQFWPSDHYYNTKMQLGIKTESSGKHLAWLGPKVGSHSTRPRNSSNNNLFFLHILQMRHIVLISELQSCFYLWTESGQMFPSVSCNLISTGKTSSSFSFFSFFFLLNFLTKTTLKKNQTFISLNQEDMKIELEAK